MAASGPGGDGLLGQGAAEKAALGIPTSATQVRGLGENLNFNRQILPVPVSRYHFAKKLKGSATSLSTSTRQYRGDRKITIFFKE